MPRVILADGLEWDRRAAVVEDGRLLAFFNDPGGDSLMGPPPLRPGAIVAVRVVRVFAERGRIGAELNGQPLSLRLGRRSPPAPGRIVLATVTAEPRESKPPQLRHGISTEGSPLPADQLERIAKAPPSQPALIQNGPDAVEAARMAFPDATLVEDGDGKAWHDAEIDSQLEAALRSSVGLAGGGVLHVNTPPGAAVFDGDSGEGELAPRALAEAMIPEVARALMLRRIGGPVVVDFPRLDGATRRVVHNGMEDALAGDPVGARCHGFASGGLYTMTRPWRWRPLADLLEPTPMRLGLDVLRLVRKAAHGHGPNPEIAVPAAAHAWLDGEGAGLLDSVVKPLAINPDLRPDDGAEKPQLTERPR